MIKIKTQSNTVSITDTAVQATPLVEEEVGHINVKVSKVKMRTRSELATDNIYVTAKNMITLNQIHKGVDDTAVQIYPEPTIVAVPTLSGTYTYTGQEQTVTISTYDPLHITVSGTTAATNAGTYTVVFSLIDTDADVWEDGTTEDKTATWVIGKVAATLTFSGSYNITDIPLRKKTTINAQANGIIGSILSSNPSVVQLNNITINNQNINFVAVTLASGTTNIQIEVLESENVSGQIFTYPVIVEAGMKVDFIIIGNELDGRAADGISRNNSALIIRGNSSSNGGLWIVNDDLTSSFLNNLSADHYDGEIARVGNYVIAAGGWSSYNTSTLVDAYNNSFVHSNPTSINQARKKLASATVGNYALLCGGELVDGSQTNVAEAYNTSLTRVTLSNLQTAETNISGTTVGNYAIIGTRITESYDNYRHDVYNTSLTRSSVSSKAYASVACRTDNYAVLSANRVQKIPFFEAYDSSLTRIQMEANSYDNDHHHSPVYFKGQALFPAIGQCVDNSLTIHNIRRSINLVGAITDNYALVTGGAYDTALYSYVA